MNEDKLHNVLAYVASHSFAPDTQLVQTEFDAMLLNAISKLRPRSAAVILLHFGLGGYDPHTFEEIALLFGISKQRVAQLEGRALTRLRELLNDDII